MIGRERFRFAEQLVHDDKDLLIGRDGRRRRVTHRNKQTMFAFVLLAATLVGLCAGASQIIYVQDDGLTALDPISLVGDTRKCDRWRVMRVSQALRRSRLSVLLRLERPLDHRGGVKHIDDMRDAVLQGRALARGRRERRTRARLRRTDFARWLTRRRRLRAR